MQPFCYNNIYYYLIKDLLKGEFFLNILHLVFSFERGGAETYIINTIERMKGKDVNFFVVCDHKGTNHDKIEKVCRNVAIIEMKNILDIKAAFRIAKFCRKNDINIIQAHFLRESFIAVLSKIFNPNIKVIWTMHLIYDEKRSLLRRMNRLFSKGTNAIICVSEAVKNSLLKEGISEKKLVTVLNGVDTDYFKPVKNSTIRKELEIEKDDILLTTVSRFQKIKGHDFLINVLNELKKNYNIKFKSLLVGDGEEMNKIKRKVKDLDLTDNVIFSGYREDIPNILTESDVYILPSENEAISFSIMEALACEVPVVATEVGGVPEVINKGKCGVMAHYGDEKRFAKAVFDLYNNKQDYEEMKKNSRILIEENFSLNKMINGTYNLYKSL